LNNVENKLNKIANEKKLKEKVVNAKNYYKKNQEAICASNLRFKAIDGEIKVSEKKLEVQGIEADY